ncbi:MAG: pseudoazurin [Alphaproteobacteria bacterium]|nr:MAG: pseudoazurin [Alphaproteobacteria bacterium]
MPCRRQFLLATGGLTFAALALAPGAAYAAVHEVRMLNRGADGAMVFEPALIRAQPGDVIRFLPTDPSHNAETIPNMLPEGATGGRGAINAVFELRVDRPGVYGIKCTPHYAMGMVAVIAVGRTLPNLDAARAVGVRAPGMAGRRFTALFNQLS